MSRLTVIASQRNPRLRQLKAAALDPRRQGLALAEGLHLVSECIERGPQPVELLVSESGRGNPGVAALLAKAAGIDCLSVSDGLYREVTGVAAPAGIAAAFRPPLPTGLPIAGDMMLLDGIQDPGNVGTLLRTAAAAGVASVFLGPGCAGAWSLKVLRAGQGAHFSLAIHEQADLLAVLGKSKAMAVATVVRDACSLYDLDLSGPVAWLFGSEGAGLSQCLLQAVGQRATIPLASGTESLNVAAAAAACLFEAHRQRLETKRPARGGPLR